MSYLLTTNPWEHLVIDNFYDYSMLTDVSKEIIYYLKTNKIVKKQTLIKTTELDFAAELPKTLKYINSNKIDESILTLFSKHRSYSKLSTYSEINVCFGRFNYPIHDEAPYKVLSAVTYLFPEKGKGTMLYGNDKYISNEVEWKPNRTLIFAPIDEVTWHSYESSSENIRVTINTFLTR